MFAAMLLPGAKRDKMLLYMIGAARHFPPRYAAAAAVLIFAAAAAIRHMIRRHAMLGAVRLMLRCLLSALRACMPPRHARCLLMMICH